MKRKCRNPFVVAALLKTGSGKHRKSNKALRRLSKVRDRSSEEEHRDFKTLRSHHIETHFSMIPLEHNGSCF